MTLLTDEAERLAAQAADTDDGDEATAGESPAAAPSTVKLTLGDRVVEVPADSAEDIRRAFDAQAGRYGSELEAVRRAAYAAPPPVVYAQPPTPQSPPPVELPDPDLMFSNKAAYQREFQRWLDARDAGTRGYSENLAQTVLGMVQNELAARENRAAAERLENEIFSETLDRHAKLQGNETFFWSVFDEEYDNIRHLRASDAYERAAEIAEQRLATLGGGTNGNRSTPAARPATPRVLSGGRSNGGTEARPPARVSITDRILERQERFLGIPAAKPA